jgi:hypothetical protein
MKSSSPETIHKMEEGKYQQYIPVYKKGFRSKTYHPNSHSSAALLAPSSKNKHRKTSASKTQIKRISRRYDKVLVFDLDETLGSFSELQWLWNAIIKYHEIMKHPISQQKQQQQLLKTLIDIYPEFLRPGILPILEYVEQKKRKGECMAVFIYTNNQHPPPWTERIVEYFNQYIEKKTNTQPFFDQTIRAFKIGQEKIEWMRTSHDKSYDDFIKCTLLPTTTEICFIDNTYFRSMIHPKVYYIQPKSYQHSLNQQDIIERFVLAETSGILDEYFPQPPTSFPSASSFLFFSTSHSQKNSRKSHIQKFIERTMEDFSKNKQQRIQQYIKHSSISTKTLENNPQRFFENIEIDLYVSNKLMAFIREFFILTTYSHHYTRKHHEEKKESVQQQIPFLPQAQDKPSLLITDSKTTT